MTDPQHTDATETTGRAASWEIVLVAPVLALAAVLAVVGLGRQNLGFDELFTYAISSHGVVSAVVQAGRDISPPLYFILESFVISIFGASEFTLRLLSATFTVLAIPVVYFAGKKLSGTTVGVWAAALFGMSRMALWYAQEARMYSLLMLLSAALLLAFAWLLERPTPSRVALLALVLVGLEYTHVYGYFAAPILAVPVLALRPLRQRVGRQVVVACAIAVAALLPWVPVLLGQAVAVRSASAAGAWWIQPPASVAAGLLGDLATYAPGNSVVGSALFVGLLACGIAVTYLRRVPRERSVAEDLGLQREIGLTLLAFAVLPALIGLLISRYVTPVHDVRYTLGALPSAVILVASGAAALKKPVGLVGLAALLVVGAAWLPSFYGNTNKGNWHEVALVTSQRPGDAVLVDGWYEAYCLDQYLRMLHRTACPHLFYRSDDSRRQLDFKSFPSGEISTMREALAGSREVLVVTGPENGRTDLVRIESSAEWNECEIERFDQTRVHVFRPAAEARP